MLLRSGLIQVTRIKIYCNSKESLEFLIRMKTKAPGKTEYTAAKLDSQENQYNLFRKKRE